MRVKSKQVHTHALKKQPHAAARRYELLSGRPNSKRVWQGLKNSACLEPTSHLPSPTCQPEWSTVCPDSVPGHTCPTAAQAPSLSLSEAPVPQQDPHQPGPLQSCCAETQQQQLLLPLPQAPAPVWPPNRLLAPKTLQLAVLRLQRALLCLLLPPTAALTAAAAAGPDSAPHQPHQSLCGDALAVMAPWLLWDQTLTPLLLLLLPPVLIPRQSCLSRHISKQAQHCGLPSCGSHLGLVT